MSALPIEGAGSTSLSHSNFAHLTVFEWNALHRLSSISGITTVAAILAAASHAQQRNAVQEFVTHELAELTRRSSTPSSSSKTDAVKFDVSSYSGEGAKRLALNRWLCEVDIAVQAHQLSTEFARTHFLLSKLSGKAKEWALGKLVAHPGCFPDMASLKHDLQLAFEPPQDENHHRSSFLALKQGRSSMLDYIQRARHLSSCIVSNPIDMVTQVHVFVSGMNTGYQCFYLTRKSPASLEDAFAIALREDFSVMASQVFQPSFHRAANEPEPMEVDAIERIAPLRHGASAGQQRSASSKQLVCFRCRKTGHRAAVCRAPAPVLAAVESDAVVLSVQPKNEDNHPAALHAQLNATTSSNDKRLIVLNVHVDGATNNFVRADSLKVIPSRMHIRELPGEMVVKYADGKPRTLQQRSVVVPYQFDGFASSDEFLVIDLSGSFDCIFGMSWLARHRPDIDWLNHTVQPRDIGVNAVLAFLAGSASTWPHVAVVDPDSTTCTPREASDGPSSTVCNTVTYTPSVEQWFLSQETAPEQWLSVCHGRSMATVRDQDKTAPEQWLPVRHGRAVASVHVDAAPTQRRSVSSKAEAEQWPPLPSEGVAKQ